MQGQSQGRQWHEGLGEGSVLGMNSGTEVAGAVGTLWVGGGRVLRWMETTRCAPKQQLTGETHGSGTFRGDGSH